MNLLRSASKRLLRQGDQEALSALLAEVAGGDRAAFATLYGQTSACLFGIVRRIVRSHAFAEEVLQEVYLRVWERSSSYDAAAGAALPWLVVIARNRAIDAIRQRGERMAASAHDDGEDMLARLAAPAEGLDFADRDELRHCLAKLDDEQCRCILLAYCHGYSREELAERFDRPVNTVKTWLRGGLAALRACLEAA